MQILTPSNEMKKSRLFLFKVCYTSCQHIGSLVYDFTAAQLKFL